ncbi:MULTISPECIES: hypothetical protein [Streptomyces]|uniref:Uncharacterized protein n=1 Tax=Streptomyces cyaneofuscatus TaxID=66883 RepID=A0ABZ1F830_9ACTN|nr:MULTISPECIES: hypothetical protein [Streptomyces]MYW35436.1 hypothetical protein [Streptomyces sp. SID2119]WSB12609.1 hypothetical protein OG849_35535 [Streptomyces cyaneofuscatus]WSD51144.1 hypothetical protein OG857_35580 [Streptomyces cyaneofuscatus]WSD51175.1 hypothetical protein OG857_35425 [Streptomyces cyaneofuscatus]
MDHDRTAAPLSADEADARARQLITEAYAPPYEVPTSYRDETEPTAYVPTPPVAQPGRPPMSQRATDASALMLSGSVAALSVGGATSLVLYTLGQVDPVTLAIGATGPVALVLAAGSLLKAVGRAKAAAAPTEVHNHYTGPVRQESTTVSSTTKGLFAKNRNDVR